MSITPITTDQLRRIQDHDGLILQGCGGSLQEWQDGINNLLTEIGILKNGSRFENIWICDGKEQWCGNPLTATEKKLVRNAILDYVEMYMDMEMSMGQQFM